MNYQFSVSIINYRRTSSGRSRGFSPGMIAPPSPPSRSSYRDRSLIKPPTNQSIPDTVGGSVTRETRAIIPLRIPRIYFLINPTGISFVSASASAAEICNICIIIYPSQRGLPFSTLESWWILLICFNFSAKAFPFFSFSFLLTSRTLIPVERERELIWSGKTHRKIPP